MGLDINGTKFLLYARSLGVSFQATAMIGRQNMQVGPEDLAANLALFGSGVSDNEIRPLISTGYAESFLEMLGATRITSFDASSYEGAAVVHDFNLPIPEEYKGKFSTVLDGGTLEHIFNFPVAIRNCLEMVQIGGHFLAITPANNQMGHGFYQFSPELFYRVLSHENGFEVEKMIIYEESLDMPWYEVIDPATAGERVTLANDRSTMLLVMAKKITDAGTLRAAPQQSDYLGVWSGVSIQNEREAPGQLERFWNAISARVNRRFGSLARISRHFRRVKLP